MKRNKIITIDPDIRGLGYMRMKHDGYMEHIIILFIFTICFTRPIKYSKLTKAIQFSPSIVLIDDKPYEHNYAGDLNKLQCVWERTNSGKHIKREDFEFVGNYFMCKILGVPHLTNYEDVYIFNPDFKVEGYLKNNRFYSIGTVQRA